MHILMYHLVDDAVTDPMSVPLHRFRDQMTLLAEHYTVLTEADLHQILASGIQPPDRSVLLTFDDGYTNTITTVLPVLEQHGLPAVMAVCGGYLTTDLPRRTPHVVDQMADLAEVRRWLETGRTVAAHSYTHQRLTTATDLGLSWQVLGDREALTELLGAPPATFVYPYGAYDLRVQRMVARVYPLAMATDEHHCVDLSHPYSLPRIQVDPSWSLTAFQAALDSDTDPATAQHRARRVDTAADRTSGVSR
ncbi:polysaccharide deacetylase family protein [Nocardia sp. 004]|uniref:polysaccharide deacetylase family protein n=1 Tax=Nocardia sp. 004 TaxID=3385978 RepID=UPI00399F2AA8